ncbi:CelD/BcsL family acetyltransferase involved in cellulose biosynthesis [Actinomycetospora cinnamomea]|uniref:CelD/BcsL family acetyltransferase involved in cellulose biosynthesis n=1 Tax=Actinomycetospora cinnamomea TaxID=663609 RepID=A0A2U1F746_9PSEU|nr:CelD/BcsL family acetyltransferase involved in cellulose biosynthesis [Actinomycetospora cinnamomea]
MAGLEVGPRSTPNGLSCSPVSLGRVSRDVEVLAEPSDEPGLVDAWRALAEAQGNAFTTPEWYAAYARHYGHDAPPFVVRVRDADGTLAGLLPLCRSGRTVRFAGANVGDRFGPVAQPGREAEVARAAAGALGREAVVLHNVDAGAPWVAALGDGLRGRVSATRLRGGVLPYVPLTGHTWETFLGARSRNFRQQVRRKERALVEGQGAVYRATSSPDEVRRDVAEFFRLHAARWDDREGGSTITSPTVHAFHDDFAAAALARGWLRMTFLEISGEAVAALYAWRIGGRYAYFQAGFDPAWAERSVGLVLMAHTVREAIAEGADEYDLLLGDETYKARFATDEREVSTLVVAGALDPTRLLAQVDAGVRRATDGMSPEMRARLRDLAKPVIARMPGTRSR